MKFRPGHTKRFWWIAAGLVVAAEIFVFLRTIPEKLHWANEPVLRLDLPEAENGEDPYAFVEQPARVKEVEGMLAFAEGRCGVFVPKAHGANPKRALDFFYFEYDPGNPRFIHDVFGHAPEICMRATGAILKQEHPSRSITIAGRSMKVLVLEFISPVSSQPLWVFRFTWLPEGLSYDPYNPAYQQRREKFIIGLLGQPKPPARVLLAAGIGYETLNEAWASYERLLVSRLKMVEPGARGWEKDTLSARGEVEGRRRPTAR
ncbi:MAG: hypothetical protein JNJ70_04645 [Verrucomicrobiales bacterium]|nr:hypothetical protein [Verrucomicrobiales bacterium]